MVAGDCAGDGGRNRYGDYAGADCDGGRDDWVIDFSFEEFVAICKDGFANGGWKTSKELDELDYAIQYVIGKEMDRGIKNIIIAEIPGLIKKYCGDDVYYRLLGDKGE